MEGEEDIIQDGKNGVIIHSCLACESNGFCHLKSLRDGQNPITEMVYRAVNAHFGCEW